VFCSSTNHLVRECPFAVQYIQQKEIICDDTGRIALPDGNYVPQGIPGKNLRERVDNYWFGKEGPLPETVATHFLEGLALGTRGLLPRGYMLITLGSQVLSDQNVPTPKTFKMCPACVFNEFGRTFKI
jgi:hypothetical protein